MSVRLRPLPFVGLVAVAAFLFAAAPAHAGIVGLLTARTVDWKFVQDTGGMKILPLESSGGKTILPVNYFVQGRTVTRQPATANSALVVRKITAKRTGHSIVLRVVTQLVEKDSNTTGRHLVDLSGIPSGRYEVFYEDAGAAEKRLGTIELP